MPDAQTTHEILRPQPRTRPRQGVDLSLKLGVAEGKNKHDRNAAAPQVNGAFLGNGVIGTLKRKD
jgi:hypothetical protein